jgi:hypothetical protein
MPTAGIKTAHLDTTATTFAPSQAKSTAVALPLPQPGPLDPAPETRATLSFEPIAARSRPKRAAKISRKIVAGQQ